MVDATMPPVMGERKPILYQNLCAERFRFLEAWINWLASEPDEAIVTAELMATQAMIRRAHDAVTGRVILNNAAETAE